MINRFLDAFEVDYVPRSPERVSHLPAGRWLEPCAGDGEIIRTINNRRSDIQWSACELREEMRPYLRPLAHEKLIMGDLLERRLEDFGGQHFDVAITNPPFNIAMPVLKKCMELSKMTILLLRLNFWGSDERQPFMEQFPPDCYVLPNRPMFSINKKGKPGTDSPEYAWMIWESPEYYEGRSRHGDIRVLKRTPKEERKGWAEHLKKLYAASLAATPAEK